MTPTAVRLVIDHVAPAQYFLTCRVETVEIAHGECLDTGNDVVDDHALVVENLVEGGLSLTRTGCHRSAMLSGFPSTTFS